MVISGDGSLDGAHAIETRSIMQVQNIRNSIEELEFFCPPIEKI